MKIFITGVAKSGTTLLRNLFHAFDKTTVVNGEASIDQLIISKSSTNIVVKRGMGSIYSHCMLTEQEKNRQLDLIRKHGIKIINIIRDRHLVVNSWQKDWGIGLQGGFEWDVICSEQPDYTIKFNDLVSSPDTVQQNIIDKFGFIKVHNFSDYPSFVPIEFNAYGNYSLRKIECVAFQ